MAQRVVRGEGDSGGRGAWERGGGVGCLFLGRRTLAFLRRALFTTSIAIGAGSAVHRFGEERLNGRQL